MIFEVDGFPGRQITANGQTYLYFGGTAYLGLQTHGAFQNKIKQNIQKYGTNYGASRKSNVRFPVFNQMENKLATMAGAEACATVSSGFLAGQLVSRHFNKPNYKQFYAPGTHVALHDGNSENVPSFEVLVEKINAFLKNPSKEIPVLFMDSVYFDATNYPDFSWLKQLPAKEIIVVADDSHAFGIVGSQGEGTYKTLSKFNLKELVVCGSLGKGFALQMGAVLGSTNIIGQLTATDFYGGSSPAAPALAATFLNASDIYASQFTKLKKNILIFQNSVKNLSFFMWMDGYPCFTFQDEAFSNYLLQNNIVVTNFRYPTEKDALMSRIVISAFHTPEDVAFLAGLCNRYQL